MPGVALHCTLPRLPWLTSRSAAASATHNAPLHPYMLFYMCCHPMQAVLCCLAAALQWSVMQYVNHLALAVVWAQIHLEKALSLSCMQCL